MIRYVIGNGINLGSYLLSIISISFLVVLQMDSTTIFLDGREIYADCGKGLNRISIDDALKLRDKCLVYASLIKGSKATPAISINAEKDVRWYTVLNVSAYLAQILKSLGFNSTYIVFHWLGAEVLINEDSIPEEIFKQFPLLLDASIAIGNYVLKNLENKLMKISRFFKGRIWFSTGLDKILIPCSRTLYENKHTVYIDVNEVDKVLESETYEDLCVIGSPFNIKQQNSISSQSLLLDIMRRGINCRPMTIRVSAKVMPKIVGRFEVMALLQAARYYVLTKDLEKAKSFGLNRAIFYAWAKHHRSGGRRIPTRITLPEKQLENTNARQIVEDQVEVVDKYFAFGDQIQTPEDFDQAVVQKVNSLIPFELIWNLTLRYVKSANVNILKDPNKFYKHIYEPVRDTYMEQLEKIVENATRDYQRKEQRGNGFRRSNVEVTSAPPIKRLTEYLKKSKDYDEDNSSSS